MRNIKFIIRGDKGASLVRGYQTAQAIEKYHSLSIQYVDSKDISNIKDSIVIFVGEPLALCDSVDNFIQITKQNNVLIYDVIDNFCFPHTNPIIKTDLFDYYKYLDVIIHPSKNHIPAFEDYLPNVKHIFIPHQWDMRNENTPTPNTFDLDKAAYIGTVFSGFQLDLDKIKDYVNIHNEPHDINSYHSKYNVQVSFRKQNSLDYLYKPCTKLAMASSFGAILLTSREPSVVDVVGDAYEFYIDSEDDLIYKMNYLKNISQAEFEHYRKNALSIKDYLSPKSNAKRYFDLIKNYV